MYFTVYKHILQCKLPEVIKAYWISYRSKNEKVSGSFEFQAFCLHYGTKKMDFKKPMEFRLIMTRNWFLHSGQEEKPFMVFCSSFYV